MSKRTFTEVEKAGYQRIFFMLPGWQLLVQEWDVEIWVCDGLYYFDPVTAAAFRALHSPGPRFVAADIEIDDDESFGFIF